MDANIADVVRHRLAILVDVPPHTIDDTTPFEELSVDSLMLLELVALVEKHLGHEIPEQDLSRFRTIEDVARYVGDASA
jgi:acyl carrier protein